MIEALRSIIDIITSLIGLVINIITSLINFMMKIPSYSAFLITSINLLPVVIIPFALLGISIYIVLFVIGR